MTTKKTKNNKQIPLLKDKKAMQEIKATKESIMNFFKYCIKKDEDKKK